jgi:hypothetical protein
MSHYFFVHGIEVAAKTSAQLLNVLDLEDISTAIDPWSQDC